MNKTIKTVFKNFNEAERWEVGHGPDIFNSSDKTINQIRPINNISFVLWNIEGLSTKLDDPDFVNYLRLFSVVCLSETLLDVFDNICLQQYNCYAAPARKLSQPGRRSRGMICFVEQSISKYFEQLNVTIENTIVFKISKLPFGSSEDILFISTYIPPMGSRFYDHKDISGGILLLERAILDLIVSREDCSVLLCGDLNARTGVKNTYFGTDIIHVMNLANRKIMLLTHSADIFCLCALDLILAS